MEEKIDKRTKSYRERKLQNAMSEQVEQVTKRPDLYRTTDAPERFLNDNLIDGNGIGVRYVRFHHPVPPKENAEPVSEFRLTAKNVNDRKYIVDQMIWTKEGLFWRCGDELNLSAAANIVYCRFFV